MRGFEMDQSTSPERLAKLDKTVGELGIVDLRAQKKDRLWIVAIKATHLRTVVTAISTGERFSLALTRAMDRLHELKRGGVNALPS